MKKLYLFLIFFIFISLCPTAQKTISYAISETGNQQIEQEFDDETTKQLQNLDFSSLEELLASFSTGQISIFGGKSFLGKIKDILSGNFDKSGGIWKGICSIFLENFLGLLPILSLILAISLIGSMLQGLKPATSSKSMGDIIHFAIYGVIVVIILSLVVKMISLTTSTIQNLKAQMDAIFPILLTLLTAIGGNTSVSVYQPAMALLSNLILNVFNFILLPLFIFSVVFNILSNLSNNIKLDKITSFFQSSYKWILGLIFTIFTAFISIQGITAGSIDGISLKTARYAIKSYVPLLGSYLSDGMSVILASSNLIKNTVGASGLFLLLATIISPLIELVLFNLALKLIAGIVEPLGNGKVASFISSISKSMVLLIVLLIGISFAYFILLGLVMCSANIV
jgi:stage III sporulation protein AE